MRAGMLDRQIQIQAPTEARGSFGEVIPGWTTLATVWAARKAGGGRESMEMGEQAASLSCEFRIRWMPGVNAKQRIVDEYGIDWRISAVEEGGRREWLTIRCEAPNV